MRTYHFFMKFIRSFFIGFGCAAAAIAIIIVLCTAVYFMYFV